MRRHTFTLGLSAVLAVSMLAGCGSKPAGDESAASSNQKQDQNASGSTVDLSQPVELTIYAAGGTSHDQFDANYGNFIKKKFPNVTINFISAKDSDGLSLTSLILHKVNVDLYYETIGTFFKTLQQNQAQFDLTDMINKNHVDLNRFEPTLIDALRDNGNGQIWGLPVTTNSMSLYYNKDLFDKFGVPYLKDGLTWEELYEIAGKFNKNDGGKQYVGLAISPSHSMRMNNYSLPFVDPKTGKSTLDDERWKQILQPLLEPAKDPSYQSKITELGNKLPYSNEFLKTQELAIFGVFSNWQIVNPQPAPFHWDLAAYPTFKDKPGVGSQQYPDYWTIPNFSQHKEMAFEVLKYLVSDEYQMELSKRGDMTVLQNPEVRKAFGTGSINKDKNLAAAYYNKFAPISRKDVNDKTVEKAITNKLVDLAMGRTDLNTALREAKEEADKAIETDNHQ